MREDYWSIAAAGLCPTFERRTAQQVASGRVSSKWLCRTLLQRVASPAGRRSRALVAEQPARLRIRPVHLREVLPRPPQRTDGGDRRTPPGPREQSGVFSIDLPWTPQVGAAAQRVHVGLGEAGQRRLRTGELVRKRRRPQSPRSIVTTTTTSTTTTVTASPVVLEAAAAAAQAAANVAAPAPTASTTVKTVRTKRRLYYGTRPRARAEGRGQQGAE